MEKSKTGNPIVDVIATLNITGNIIPEAWYRTIVNSEGIVNYIAILILADILYWYRPSEEQDKTTLTVKCRKKFLDEQFLQRSYPQLMEKFSISRGQAYRAIIFLEKLGVIKRHFRTIIANGIKSSNVMYIELVPEVLKALTFPKEEMVAENTTSSLPKQKELYTKMKTPTTFNEKTNTKKKTKIKAKTTTVDDVVAQARILLEDLNLSDKDIEAIVTAADNNIAKCVKAKEILLQQSNEISNVVGWLIHAIQDDYQLVSKSPASKKNSFNNFQQRQYQHGELENILLNSSIK